MCRAPNTLADGTQVACRECWQCRKARVDDLVGRGIAEMRTTPVGCHTVTLTYGRDRDESSITYGDAEHVRAAVLTYSDVQKMLKLLRRHGYPCRYLVTGEYGSKKGRAHFHAILFWQERVPPGIVLHENIRFARYDDKTGEPAMIKVNGKEEPAEFWPHGHTFWQEASYEAFRYNLKYVLKELGQGAAEAQYRKGQSRFPPLGTAYFDDLARRTAQAGLVPLDGSYSFPEALRKNGERIQFRLQGRAEEMYREAYVRWWRQLHGDKPMPHSEYMHDWLEAQGMPMPLDKRELRQRRADYAGTVRAPHGQFYSEYWSDDDYLEIAGGNESDFHKLVPIVAEAVGEWVNGAYRLPEAEWSSLMDGSAVRWNDALNSYVYDRGDGNRWLWTFNKQEGNYEWRKLAGQKPVSRKRGGRVVRQPQPQS